MFVFRLFFSPLTHSFYLALCRTGCYLECLGLFAVTSGRCGLMWVHSSSQSSLNLYENKTITERERLWGRQQRVPKMRCDHSRRGFTASLNAGIKFMTYLFWLCVLVSSGSARARTHGRVPEPDDLWWFEIRGLVGFQTLIMCGSSLQTAVFWLTAEVLRPSWTGPDNVHHHLIIMTHISCCGQTELKFYRCTSSLSLETVMQVSKLQFL